MIKINNLPDNVFGIDSRLFLLWLQPVALFFGILFSVILIIVPKFNEVLGKIADIKSTDNKIVDLNQKRNYLQSVDQEEIKNNADKLSLGLLPEKDAYMLVRVLRNAAAEASFTIDDFSISMGDIKGETGVKKDNTNYDKIPVKVTLVGPSNNYLSLVKSIERSLPVMSIDKLEMNSAQEQVSIVKLEVSAYYLREINTIKMENLSLTDLTPSQDEVSLLSKISEYKVMLLGNNDAERTFIKYERIDPFSTL